jgi:hypothetical protein
LESWLKRKHNFTSSTIQNDIIKTISSVCLREIIASIKQDGGVYGIVVDGTTDVQGKEQEAICIRYVDDNLEIYEQFLGLYNLETTTGEAISEMIVDVLTRFDLPISKLRAQTYDGAANMAGKFNGCQVHIKKRQPLALFTTCGAHSTNLVVSKAVEEAEFLRDALSRADDVITMYGQSRKFKNLYSGSGLSSDDESAIMP